MKETSFRFPSIKTVFELGNTYQTSESWEQKKFFWSNLPCYYLKIQKTMYYKNTPIKSISKFPVCGKDLHVNFKDIYQIV